MREIFIVNAHWSNRGDEAALRPIVNFIKSNYLDVKLNIIFKEKMIIDGFLGYSDINCYSIKFLPNSIEQIEEMVNKESESKNTNNVEEDTSDGLLQTIRLLKNADLIIYSPGGSVICNRFWWEKQLEYLVPFVCSKKNNIPMVVAAPSIGPFGNASQVKVLKKYLSVSKYICVREEISRQYLRDIDINENVITTIDTAFYDDFDENREKKNFFQDNELKTFFSTKCKIVGITISDFMWHVKYGKDEKTKNTREQIMRDFIEYLENCGYGILLIPQLFLYQNDYEYLKKFETQNTYILSDKYDTYFQQFVISKLYAVVGMRYHSNIFAAKASVPFIAIAYEEKMIGFMEKWAMNDYLVLLQDLTINKLKERWNFLCDHYQEYGLQLKNNREKWRNFSEYTIDAIKDTIENTDKYALFFCSRFYRYFNELVEKKDRLKQKNVKVIFFQTPLKDRIQGLTEEELYRIDNWTFDFNNISKEDCKLLKTVYPKGTKTQELIELFEGAKVYESQGIKYLSDFKSEKVNVISGKRFTSFEPDTYSNKIWIYGQCTARGTGVEDTQTVASYLQREINSKFMNSFKVVNCAVGCGSDIHDDLNHIEEDDIQSGDIVIFCTNLEIVPIELFKKNNIDYYDTSCVFHRPEYSGTSWFTDSTFHTTAVGNEKIAHFIYNSLKEKACLKNSMLEKKKINENIISKVDISQYKDELNRYLNEISKFKKTGRKGAIVMNCNPFTLGHQYLIETAAAMVDYLYVFVLLEDKSFFSYEDRMMLVKKGTNHLDNVIVLSSGKFIISAITFPGYFNKENDNTIQIDSSKDLKLFGEYIAKELDISIRFAGTEPNDMVTAQYNKDMRKILPKYNIKFIEIARKEIGNKAVSASLVRKAFKDNDFKIIEEMVPKTTYEYLLERYKNDR